jgi:hypothetical protein
MANPNGEPFTCSVDGTGAFHVNISPDESQFFQLAPNGLVMEEVEAEKFLDVAFQRHKAKLAAAK